MVQLQNQQLQTAVSSEREQTAQSRGSLSRGTCVQSVQCSEPPCSSYWRVRPKHVIPVADRWNVLFIPKMVIVGARVQTVAHSRTNRPEVYSHIDEFHASLMEP